jgi:hypothetical protein
MMLENSAAELCNTKHCLSLLRFIAQASRNHWCVGNMQADTKQTVNAVKVIKFEVNIRNLK